MVKVYTPRRLRERNRWLRSDGKPNFKGRIHEKPHELDPLVRRDTPTASDPTPILKICELMTSSRVRLVPIISADCTINGVVTGMDVIDYLGGGPKHRIVESRGLRLLYPVLNLPVSEIMRQDPIVIDIDTKLPRLLEVMINFGVGAVPIVSKRGYEGIITEREVMKHLAGKIVGVQVKDVMTEEVITVEDGKTLEDAMKLMIETGVRRLPVVYGKTVSGIISWRNIIDLVGTHEVFKIVKSKTIDELKSIPVREVMRKEIVTIYPEADLGEAVNVMLEKNVGSLLVTENNELKGIVTEKDIIYGLLVG